MITRTPLKEKAWLHNLFSTLGPVRCLLFCCGHVVLASCVKLIQWFLLFFFNHSFVTSQLPRCTTTVTLCLVPFYFGYRCESIIIRSNVNNDRKIKSSTVLISITRVIGRRVCMEGVWKKWNKNLLTVITIQLRHFETLKRLLWILTSRVNLLAQSLMPALFCFDHSGIFSQPISARTPSCI